MEETEQLRAARAMRRAMLGDAYVDSMTAERLSLIRLPRLKPTTRKGPILPGFDIHIGELRIDRLDIGPGVGGTRCEREPG